MAVDIPRVLFWTTLAHVVVAIACAAALARDAPPVLGLHPASKPLKFAVSIAVFLGTMAVLLSSLSVAAETRVLLAWVLAGTMAIEMLAILGQALRGTTSHFNVRSGVDTAVWNAMLGAIVVATAAIVGIAIVATVRPLQGMPPLLTFAWRAGLWILVLTPLSGFAMGGRLRHSIGGADGEAGLPLVNWSVRHGDLRVTHFFALHAVQLLPLAAWALLRLPVPPWLRVAALVTTTVAMVCLCVGTLVQALAGRPFLR